MENLPKNFPFRYLWTQPKKPDDQASQKVDQLTAEMSDKKVDSDGSQK
jgi:hypothetical protein